MRLHPRRRYADLHVRVFFLQIIGVKPGEESIPPPVVQAQQRADIDAPHSALAGPFRRIQPKMVVPLGTGRMQFRIGHLVVGFLKHRHFINPSHRQFGVLFRRQGVNFQADAGEVFAQNSGCRRNVRYGGFLAGIAGQNQQMPQSASGNRRAFRSNLRRR